MATSEAVAWSDVFAWVDQAMEWARDVARLPRSKRREFRGDLERALDQARASGAAPRDVRVYVESEAEGHLRFVVVTVDEAAEVLHARQVVH